MNRKNKSDKDGFVFSTDPDFKFDYEDEKSSEIVLPEHQRLKIRLDKKHRGGKAVTLIEGYIGSEEDLKELGKNLKNFCGTGGSAKDKEIIIQGDQRDKVLQWLLKNNFKNSKKI